MSKFRTFLSTANIDFIGRRRIAYLITAALFIPGFIFFLFRGLDYSIEFTGGTMVHVAATEPIEVGTVRESLSSQGFEGAEIQHFGNEREVVIRVRLSESDEANAEEEASSARVRGVLDQTFGAGKYTLVRVESVGPKVGAELRTKAIIAILLSSLVILGYMAIRFEWRFGLAAITATLHDVAGTILFVCIAQIEVSLVVVGALLSVLGISLNETIIIFDRVRENERHKQARPLDEVLNRSINETLPRTVLTHGTALSTMLTLLLFGGEVIRPFALVMFWGVSTGIFSSMFIAPSMLRFIRKRWPASNPVAAARPAAPARKLETAKTR